MQADNNKQAHKIAPSKKQKYQTIQHKLDINEEVLTSNMKVTYVNNECQTHGVHIWQKQKPNIAKSAVCGNNVNSIPGILYLAVLQRS